MFQINQNSLSALHITQNSKSIDRWSEVFLNGWIQPFIIINGSNFLLVAGKEGENYNPQESKKQIRQRNLSKLRKKKHK